MPDLMGDRPRSIAVLGDEHQAILVLQHQLGQAWAGQQGGGANVKISQGDIRAGKI